MLTEKDYKQIKDKGIHTDQLKAHVDRYRTGFDPIRLLAPATVEDGIVRLSDIELEDLISLYQETDCTVEKFVPASGAASRMFKLLFTFLDDGEENDQIIEFFTNLESFAFYQDLNNACKEIHGKGVKDFAPAEKSKIIDVLLNKPGLDYGQLPKGLLCFHNYESGARTPVGEHIAEGIAYAKKNDRLSIHFTVSPSHQEGFEEHVDEVITDVEKKTVIHISYSTQDPATDIVAVDSTNEPFRNETGELLFRPAGHGALLKNLNEIDADIVFIKNIDNVVPDKLKEETIRFKQVLAGILIQHQLKVFDLLHQSDEGKSIEREGKSLLSKMGCRGDFTSEEIIELLNRPIRVCGMVKNEGEPGGGPFWVKKGKVSSLQIVEAAEVNTSDQNQLDIFKNATHFNPVDLVCGIKNYKGEAFDLMKFRNPELGFITEKSYQGRHLKAMELPGLWNGSMAFWNTIFVEVPLITFNPVKTIMDLLKDTHR